jgi:hypothetical protein
MKGFRVLVVTALVAGAALLMAPLSASASGASSTPRWIRHIQRYPGGISAGVRAMVSPAAAAARA